MKNRFKHSINYIAVKTAFISFIAGILCLLLFKTSSDSGIFALGYFYTLLAFIVNSIFLIIVVINTLLKLKDYPEHLKTIFAILLNIPIIGLYQNLL